MTTTEHSSSFADRQRGRLAAGKVGTAALLDAVEARSPDLRAYAERLIARGPPPDHRGAGRDLVGSIAALRMLNARRELARQLAVLRDDPDHPDAPAWRNRVLEITRWVRDAERSGTVPHHPWARLLAQEARR